MKFLLSLVLLLLTTSAFSTTIDKIKKFDWNGIEVVWLEDNRFPTYDIIVYFADGALSDGRHIGESKAAFDLLETGTRRFSQGDIADNLEFFGANYGGSVIHEYSTYNISGLAKDVIPTMKKVCHMFRDAVYPKKVIKKEIKRHISSLTNLVRSPEGLVDRIFREIVFKNTPYLYPAGGKLKHLRKISQKSLRRKLKYFNEKVKKRIYITGPRSVLDIKSVIKRDCHWSGSASFVRSIDSAKKIKAKKQMVFVPLKGASQTQIRIGRFFNESEIGNKERKTLASEYLGGGLSSVLMQELRVKRGLTYNVRAVMGGQKQYGRSIIMTSTKNESVVTMLEEIKNIFDGIKEKGITEELLVQNKRGVIGSYPFSFETPSSFISRIMVLDHAGESYDSIKKFPAMIEAQSSSDVAGEIFNAFDWDRQSIVVLGPNSLLKKLQKKWKVKVMKYENFL